MSESKGLKTLRKRKSSWGLCTHHFLKKIVKFKPRKVAKSVFLYMTDFISVPFDSEKIQLDSLITEKTFNYYFQVN